VSQLGASWKKIKPTQRLQAINGGLKQKFILGDKGQEVTGKRIEKGEDKKELCSTLSPSLALSFSRTVEEGREKGEKDRYRMIE
jgi:hypothetical protein